MLLRQQLPQYMDLPHFRDAEGLGQKLAGFHEAVGVLCPPLTYTYRPLQLLAGCWHRPQRGTARVFSCEIQ